MFKVILAGSLIGVANLIPGISGATLAVLTNQYERIISELSILSKGQFKKLNISYLGFIGTGALIGIFGLSFPLHYAFVTFKGETFAVIIGLVIGSMSGVQISKEKRSFIHRYLNIYFCIGFLIMLGLVILDTTSAQLVGLNNWALLFFAGVIAMAAMIIPGISGSMILVMMGAYDVVLRSVKDVDIIALVPCILGAAIGGLIFLKGIKFCLDRIPNIFESLILGLVIGSILYLIVQAPGMTIIQDIIFISIGALISEGTLFIAKKYGNR